MKTTNPTAAHALPMWGAYKSNGQLAALLESESEAHFYIKNRGHMWEGSYRKIEPLYASAPDLLAALEEAQFTIRNVATRIENREAEMSHDLHVFANSLYDLLAKAKGQP